MLHMEIIAVCSEIRTGHINTLCGQNGELLNVKLGGTQPPVQWVPGLSRGLRCGRGVTLTPHPF